MLVWGDVNQAFDPATNRWRRLPPAPAGRGGIVVWTGQELVEWGGGCCGDVSSDGAAYNPSTDSWRKIALPPVGGQQSPVGAWTGKELVIFPGQDPEGKAGRRRGVQPGDATRGGGSPRRHACRAARTPSGTGTRCSSPAGREASALSTAGLAYDPGTNRSRRLPPDRRARGSRGGVDRQTAAGLGRADLPGRDRHRTPRADLRPDRKPLVAAPQSPLPARVDPTVVWTGRELIVWGGSTMSCRRNAACDTQLHADGAAFRPAAP